MSYLIPNGLSSGNSARTRFRMKESKESKLRSKKLTKVSKKATQKLRIWRVKYSVKLPTGRICLPPRRMINLPDFPKTMITRTLFLGHLKRRKSLTTFHDQQSKIGTKLKQKKEAKHL
jgi:hypothetical protein